jgi:hypothetical protein
MNLIGLNKAKSILRGDGMFIENVQRFADVICSHDAPCSDITDVNNNNHNKFVAVTDPQMYL